MLEPVRCSVLADFNAANLASYLDAGPARLQLTTAHRLIPDLEAASDDESVAAVDALVVWFRAERVSASLATALDGRPVATDAADGVDRFAGLVKKLAARGAMVLVPSWIVPPPHRGWGMSSFDSGSGPAALVQAMNARLLEQLAGCVNVRVLDAARWIAAAGQRA